MQERAGGSPDEGVVREPVVDEPAISLLHHHPREAQGAELVARRCLARSDDDGDVAHAEADGRQAGIAGERRDDAEPGLVGEHGRELNRPSQAPVIRRPGARGGDFARVDNLHVAPVLAAVVLDLG